MCIIKLILYVTISGNYAETHEFISWEFRREKSYCLRGSKIVLNFVAFCQSYILELQHPKGSSQNMYRINVDRSKESNPSGNNPSTSPFTSYHRISTFPCILHTPPKKKSTYTRSNIQPPTRILYGFRFFSPRTSEVEYTESGWQRDVSPIFIFTFDKVTSSVCMCVSIYIHLQRQPSDQKPPEEKGCFCFGWRGWQDRYVPAERKGRRTHAYEKREKGG